MSKMDKTELVLRLSRLFLIISLFIALYFLIRSHGSLDRCQAMLGYYKEEMDYCVGRTRYQGGAYTDEAGHAVYYNLFSNDGGETWYALVDAEEYYPGLLERLGERKDHDFQTMARRT